MAHSVVSNTDPGWYEHFRPLDELKVVDEVNFWRPTAQSRFRALEVGGPFFFRLRSPINAIAGFGFFAVQSFLSVRMAWEIFGDRNGDLSLEAFARRIGNYRNVSPEQLLNWRSDPISCLVLREVTFLPNSEWIPWEESKEWAANIVAFKGYDLSQGPGVYLSELLMRAPYMEPADLVPDFEPLIAGLREATLVETTQRVGQGTFRTRVLNAYRERCAITGERALPVLDAAHIQPYTNVASNHIQNGLLLRTDLHRLYDEGYLTVTPDFRVEVSRRLREEFDNGEPYYPLAGKSIDLPTDSILQPSKKALDWHASNIFH